MSLGNWEGKVSNEAEPEELPEIKAIKKSCDGQELVSKEYYAFQFVFMRTEKRFFVFFYLCKRNSASSVEIIEK